MNDPTVAPPAGGATVSHRCDAPPEARPVTSVPNLEMRNHETARAGPHRGCHDRS